MGRKGQETGTRGKRIKKEGGARREGEQEGKGSKRGGTERGERKGEKNRGAE